MTHSSLVIFTSILGMLELTFLSGPMVGQPLLPDGSVIVSPRTPPLPDSCAGSVGSADDSNRIQQAIDRARGTVFFKAGCYYLKHSLRLRSGLTYMGEGSWFSLYGSVLMQTASPDPITGLGVPIFYIDGVVEAVAIVGLAFDAPAPPSSPTKARGIAAVNSQALLVNSTIRGNYFLIELSECIDTPMLSTRIERNGFGTNGQPGQRHRHIHSVYPGRVPPPAAGDNWIVSNVYRYACCESPPGAGTASESVLFESRVPLHIIGNDFEAGDVDTTLRIRGAPQVFIEGNYFEGNHGQAQMTVSPRGSRVQVEDNRYVMDGYQKTLNVCNGTATTHNCLILEFEPGLSASGVDASLPATQVYMGYEAVGLLPSYGDLVPADVFAACHLADSDEENRSFRADDDQDRRRATLSEVLCSR